MNDFKIIAVIIGVVGALIGVYFRERITIAKARLSAAVTLESTLHYWLNLAMQNKHFRELLATGHVLGEKEKKTFLSGNIEKIDEFRNSFEKVLNEAKETLIEEQKDNIETIIAEIQNLSDEEYSEVLTELNRYRDSLSDLSGSLSQEKLSVLDWHKLPKIIEIKTEIQSILGDFKFGIIHIHSNKEPSIEKVSVLIFSIITSILKASKNIIPLLEYSKSIREKGLLGNLLW